MESHLPAQFRENLRRRRESLGLSQQVVANRMGVPRTYISDIERGRHSVSLGQLDRFSEALKCKPALLLEDPPTEIPEHSA